MWEGNKDGNRVMVLKNILLWWALILLVLLQETQASRCLNFTDHFTKQNPQGMNICQKRLQKAFKGMFFGFHVTSDVIVAENDNVMGNIENITEHNDDFVENKDEANNNNDEFTYDNYHNKSHKEKPTRRLDLYISKSMKAIKSKKPSRRDVATFRKALCGENFDSSIYRFIPLFEKKRNSYISRITFTIEHASRSKLIIKGVKVRMKTADPFKKPGKRKTKIHLIFLPKYNSKSMTTSPTTTKPTTTTIIPKKATTTKLPTLRITRFKTTQTITSTITPKNTPTKKSIKPWLYNSTEIEAPTEYDNDDANTGNTTRFPESFTHLPWMNNTSSEYVESEEEEPAEEESLDDDNSDEKNTFWNRKASTVNNKRLQPFTSPSAANEQLVREDSQITTTETIGRHTSPIKKESNQSEKLTPAFPTSLVHSNHVDNVVNDAVDSDDFNVMDLNKNTRSHINTMTKAKTQKIASSRSQDDKNHNVLGNRKFGKTTERDLIQSIYEPENTDYDKGFTTVEQEDLTKNIQDDAKRNQGGLTKRTKFTVKKIKIADSIGELETFDDQSLAIKHSIRNREKTKQYLPSNLFFSNNNDLTRHSWNRPRRSVIFGNIGKRMMNIKTSNKHDYYYQNNRGNQYLIPKRDNFIHFKQHKFSSQNIQEPKQQQRLQKNQQLRQQMHEQIIQRREQELQTKYRYKQKRKQLQDQKRQNVNPRFVYPLIFLPQTPTTLSATNKLSQQKQSQTNNPGPYQTQTSYQMDKDLYVNNINENIDNVDSTASQEHNISNDGNLQTKPIQSKQKPMDNIPMNQNIMLPLPQYMPPQVIPMKQPIGQMMVIQPNALQMTPQQNNAQNPQIIPCIVGNCNGWNVSPGFQFMPTKGIQTSTFAVSNNQTKITFNANKGDTNSVSSNEGKDINKNQKSGKYNGYEQKKPVSDKEKSDIKQSTEEDEKKWPKDTDNIQRQGDEKDEESKEESISNPTLIKGINSNELTKSQNKKQSKNLASKQTAKSTNQQEQNGSIKLKDHSKVKQEKNLQESKQSVRKKKYSGNAKGLDDVWRGRKNGNNDGEHRKENANKDNGLALINEVLKTSITTTTKRKITRRKPTKAQLTRAETTIQIFLNATKSDGTPTKAETNRTPTNTPTLLNITTRKRTTIKALPSNIKSSETPTNRVTEPSEQTKPSQKITSHRYTFTSNAFKNGIYENKNGDKFSLDWTWNTSKIRPNDLIDFFYLLYYIAEQDRLSLQKTLGRCQWELDWRSKP